MDSLQRVPTPNKRFGQHFLYDPKILRTIVEKAGVSSTDAVLEIGPGPGGLTRALLETGAKVWAVELDSRMIEHLESQNMKGLTLLRADALDLEYPALVGEVGSKFKLVGNLPYQISGPLIAKLLQQREAFTSMTVMLQKEVADRLVAPSGGKSRGGLSVLTQCFCEAKIVMRVSPGSFHPPPKVQSSVVHMDVKAESPVTSDEEKILWKLVKAGFGQRRKMIRNTLKIIGPALELVLESAKLKGTERAEALSLDSWLALVSALSDWNQRNSDSILRN